MPGSRIQLDGVIRLGPAPGSLVEFSDDISSLVFNLTRNQVTVPPTYGKPRETIRLGARKDSAAINFMSDETDVSGVHATLIACFLADEGVCYFEAAYLDAPTDFYTGSFSVAQMNIGTTVGEWKMQTETYPVVTFVTP